MERFRVEIVDSLTGNVVSTVGSNLSEERAEKRELTGLSRIENEGLFVRTVEER